MFDQSETNSANWSMITVLGAQRIALNVALSGKRPAKLCEDTSNYDTVISLRFFLLFTYYCCSQIYKFVYVLYTYSYFIICISFQTNSTKLK